MKKHYIVSAKFDLPFYLRLPCNRFISYDEKHKFCLIIPLQKLGEKLFNKETKLVKENELLDDPQIHPLTTEKIPEYDYQVRSILNGKEIVTLETRLRQNGGFTQLHPYTELSIFVYVFEEDPNSETVKQRIFANLNHFVNIYQLVTQDPTVFKIDYTFNLYCIDLSIGKINCDAEDNNILDILSLKEVTFFSNIGDKREVQLQLNILDDIYPGNILNKNFLKLISDNITGTYNMPLFYELILESQKQLKLRNFSGSVIEAQTAVESYISHLLTIFMTNSGFDKEKITQYFQDNMLHKRLRNLDEYVESYKTIKKEAYDRFVKSNLYKEWKAKLYSLRNMIVHEGYREIDFEKTREAIGIGKKVIFHFEKLLPEYSNTVQIYQGVDFLKNTAGRLIF